MQPLVTFYFDPVSPYAWLASRELERVEAAGARIEVAPVLFAGMLNAHGQKGPAEIPAKRRYTFRDVMRQAALRGLPFRGPPGHPFNPLAALRLCLAAQDIEARRRLALSVMEACWERGEDIEDHDVLGRLADACGLDGAGLVAATASAPVKAALARATQQAIDGGIFGVPTFRHGDELFWGGDRIDALLAHLRGAGIDEARLDAFLALPPRAQRRG